MTRPLENRFPTLYHDIVHERNPKTGESEEKRTPKEVAPTLSDVIAKALSANGIHANGAIVADVTECVTEFLAVEEPKKKD